MAIISGAALEKRFSGNKALNAINFTIEPQKITGLLGGNGGGKSTLLKMIAGLEKPTSGILTVLGVEMPSGARRVGKRLGYMAQTFTVYGELTVLENLRFRAALYNVADVEQAVEKSVATFALVPFLNIRAAELSGGWARMLQLAGALIHEPELILLDEPTAGLDADARRSVWAHIRRLADEGRTIVIATHDMQDAADCDHLLLLANGHLLAAGSVEEITVRADLEKYFINNSIFEITKKLDEQNSPYVQTCGPSGCYLVVDKKVGHVVSPFLRKVSLGQSDVTALLPTLEPARVGLTLEETAIMLKRRHEILSAAAHEEVA